MATVADAQRLDAALAQIDRAFGKDAAEREHIKVWLDPFTEERVREWLREQVDSYIEEDDWHPSDAERMWETIFDRMGEGEHRILTRHPFDRVYPGVSIGERIDLFFRRILGRFQRTEDQKLDAFWTIG